MLKIVGIALGLIVAGYMFVIAPSFVGKTGSDGKVLKKYAEPEQLKELTENPDENIWIIDVRSENKWNKSHVPTAKSYFSGDIESRLDEIPKDKYLIIYCETGGRVHSVVKNVLKPNGYTRYMNWGGFSRWPYETESK